MESDGDIHFMVCLALCLFVYVSIYQPVCLLVCPSVWLSVYLSIWQYVCWSVCLSVCLSSCLPVCSSVSQLVRIVSVCLQLVCLSVPPMASPTVCLVFIEVNILSHGDCSCLVLITILTGTQVIIKVSSHQEKCRAAQNAYCPPKSRYCYTIPVHQPKEKYNNRDRQIFMSRATSIWPKKDFWHLCLFMTTKSTLI